MRLHRVAQRAGAIAFLILVSCSDGPSGPAAAVPRRVEPVAGNEQEGEAGQPLPVAPAVAVRNAGGDGLRGVTVRFAVVLGGGTVENDSAVTDERGVASAGRWTLGPAPGPQVLEAAAAGLPPARFTATARSPWHIDVRYLGNATPVQRLSVERAVARWRSIIIRDLSVVPVSLAAERCFEGQPALSEVVDDLLIFIRFGPIDGPGKVLGRAGPCLIRSTDNLPILGFLLLDSDDLVQVERAGVLDDLVLHEIGHIIGFGTLWPLLDLVTDEGGGDPRFLGENAIDAYRALGGSRSSIPVENTGMAGTRDSHWRESVFGDELMTGFLSACENPLSLVTVESIEDLGYSVYREAADAYVLSPSQAAVRVMDLHGREEILAPLFRVERTGEMRRIPALLPAPR